jgi:Flp pilus assembly protein TadG
MDKPFSLKVSRTSRFRNASRALCAGTFRRFWKDTYGGAMIYIGLSLPVLLGFSGMAVDGSIWFANKRSMQASADAAAFSAALEMTRINDDTLAKSRAKLDAQENAYDPTTGDIIEVNSPPKYGPYSGNNAAFEAIVSRPSPSFLSRLIHGEQVTVTARAVAIVANPGGTPCVLTLDPDMPDAIKVNNGTLNAGGCRVHANSTDPGALHVFSGGELDADDVDLVANGYINDGTMSSTPEMGKLPVPDPFAGIPTPSVGTCDHTDMSLSGNQYYSLSPGTYCGGISISGKADVHFEPGTYVITDSNGNPGSLHVTGNHASVEGDDVMIYTDGESTINIGGQGEVDLAASTTGNYAGILFYGNPDASESLQHSITGNANMLYEGYMYFRTSVLKVNGNGNGESTNYVGAVAREIRFGGNGEMLFQYDPSQPGVPPLAGGTTVTMVE